MKKPNRSLFNGLIGALVLMMAIVCYIDCSRRTATRHDGNTTDTAADTLSVPVDTARQQSDKPLSRDRSSHNRNRSNKPSTPRTYPTRSPLDDVQHSGK